MCFFLYQERCTQKVSDSRVPEMVSTRGCEAMKRKGDRNWDKDPVSKDELESFRIKVQKLSDEEFDIDDEGDSTVEVRLTDRTHGHMPPFVQVPYKDGLMAATYNFKVAFESWEREDLRARDIAAARDAFLREAELRAEGEGDSLDFDDTYKKWKAISRLGKGEGGP